VHDGIDLSAGVFHVTVNGKLYAVVSRRSGIGVWPIANPAQLRHAEWHHRPDSADDIPGSFIRMPLPEAMWQYATRTTRDCLPAHYRRKRLYLRRPPPVPSRLLSDPCLMLVRELSRSPGTFAELIQRTGTLPADLARHLGALYVVGSVTANATRLAAPQDSTWNSSLSSNSLDSTGTGPEMTVRLKAADGPQETTN